MGILRRLDCSVIILWFGVFIWMEGLNKTGLPQYLWHLGGLTISDFSSVSHISILFAITMVPSIAVGNNTMAMICLMLLVPCADQLPFVLLLAWLLAMAGNLTLFSSVTNISVARESIRATRHKFSYWAHLQYAFPTTLALAILGIVIICGLLQLHWFPVLYHHPCIPFHYHVLSVPGVIISEGSNPQRSAHPGFLGGKAAASCSHVHAFIHNFIICVILFLII